MPTLPDRGRGVALTSALALGSFAEWYLADLAGLGRLALLVPVMIDSAALVFFATGQYVGLMLGVLGIVTGGGHALHGWRSVPAAAPVAEHAVRAGLGAVVGLTVVGLLLCVERAAVAAHVRRDALADARAQRDAATAELDAERQRLTTVSAELERTRQRAAERPPAAVPPMPARPAEQAASRAMSQATDAAFLADAKAAAARVIDRNEPLTRDNLRDELKAAGVPVGNARAGRLLAIVRQS